MRLAIFYLISLIPFPVLYVISDLLALVAGRIIGYRRDVILKNLRNSFPQKSEKEIKDLLPGIYRNLTDVMMETFKLLSMNEAEVRKRILFTKKEVVEKYFERGQTVIIVSSHTCNWEWSLAACSIHLSATIDAVYQVITSRFFDALMIRIRSRFGSIPVEKKDVYRESIKKRNIPHILALVADQSPPVSDTNVYRTKFLNQDTIFYNGMERISTGFNWPVVYVRMIRTRRGHYEIDFVEVGANPATANPGTILEKFIEIMEASIISRPETWLWSHNRWKWKPSGTDQTA